jgi:hypothetical protein
VGYRDIGGERRGGGNHAPSSLFHYFFNVNLIFFFSKMYLPKKCQKLSSVIPPPSPPPSPTPWAKEGDSYDHGRGFGYDHGRGFIVRILGGQKRETVMTMVRIS